MKSTENPIRDVVDLALATMRAISPAVIRRTNQSGVSIVQILLLSQLERWDESPETEDDDEVTMTRIARWVGHSTAAATGLIDRLERFGYVERRFAAYDRRKVLVRITQKGRALLAEVKEAAETELGEMIIEAAAKARPAASPIMLDSIATLLVGERVPLPHAT